jgi:hypothetical protein
LLQTIHKSLGTALEIKKEYEIRYMERDVKVKFALEQAMKAQRGSRGIALLFL